MLNFKYLPIHFSPFLIIGIIFGNTFDYTLTTIFIIAILALLFLVYFYFRAELSFNPPKYFVILTAILFLIIGVLSITIQKPQYQKEHYTNHTIIYNHSILRINKILKPNKYYQRFEAEIIQLNKKNTKGKVLVNIKIDSLIKNITVDKLLFTTNEYKEIKQALNPYEFNYREYLKKQQIHHQIILTNEDYKILNSKQETLRGIAFSLREKINQELEKYDFSVEELAIINALLLGQRQDISKELFEQYKNAGAIHILAVSGLHIGIVLLILNFLFKPLESIKNGKIIKLVLLVISLWLYAFIAGFSASIVRAVTMFTAISIGLATNRQSGVKNSLIASMFILLLLHPLYLFDVGFQLSYTAVFSIVWIQPFFSNLWKPKHKIINYFWQLLTVSFAAQLGILPLSLLYFHQFPGLFFVSSLVIIPFLGIVLGLGFLVIILALVNFLPQFLATFYGAVIKTMNDFVAFISQQESFVFQDISFSLLLMISFYVLLINTMNWLEAKSIKNLYFVLISILLIQVNLVYEKVKVQKTNEFIVFHQSKNSFFGNRKGNKLTIYHSPSSTKSKLYSPINSYKTGLSNLDVQQNLSINNILKINSKHVLIIDSLGVYDSLSFSPEMVILIQSPKINFERMIQKIKPKTIIADGSNYKSYVRLCQKTCENKKIYFHNTTKNGAYEYHY